MRSTFLLPLAASVFTQTARASLYGESKLNHTCTFVTPELSCSAGALPELIDSCCVETFGGLVLSTQFWDTYTGLESEGQILPKDSWTLHGLWPDFCNGSYTQYCDLSRQYDTDPWPRTTNGQPDGTPIPPYVGPTIDTFLQPFGKDDLLAWMNKYWISQGTRNPLFWAHEFSKHATCYSTFDIPCYGPQYVEHQDVVEFFETAAMYFQYLPTWGWLAAANIFPSNTTSYTLGDLQSALTAGFGALPYVGCSGPRYNHTAAGEGSDDDGHTVLDEVWYYHHVFGAPQRGQGVAVDAAMGGGVTSCAKAEGAIWYYERAVGSEAD